MNVFLATDSSGVLPAAAGEGKPCNNTNGWTSQLMRLHPNIKFVCQRSFCEVRLGFSLYQLGFLNRFPNDFFDVGIIKCGYHERIAYYPIPFMQRVVGGAFNPRHLRYLHKFNKKEMYSYRDIDSEKKLFDIVNKKCKRSFFVGIHNLSDLEEGYNPTYESNAEEMRMEYSQMTSEYIDIPTTQEWKRNHVGSDHIHLSSNGIQYMIETLSRILK